MKEEILSRDFDLGFSGNSEDVVMRALHLLENCINVTSSSSGNGEFTIAPGQTVPALFELNFYSNGLFHVFISDAVIGEQNTFKICSFVLLDSVISSNSSCLPPACSILSLQRELMLESDSHNLNEDPSGLLLGQERLIRKAAGLAHFLINEVAVAPVSTLTLWFQTPKPPQKI